MHIYIGEKDHPSDGGWQAVPSIDGSHAPLYLPVLDIIQFKEKNTPEVAVQITFSCKDTIRQSSCMCIVRWP